MSIEERNYIIRKGKDLALAFIWCFTNESTDKYKHEFALNRYQNLLDEDLNIDKFIPKPTKEHKELFCKTFIAGINYLLPNKAKLEEMKMKSFK